MVANQRGCAVYDANNNRLEVIRPGESVTRYISCVNLRPTSDKVYGVEIEGDEILLLIGPPQNRRPQRKIGYRFSSLTGGYGRSV